MSEGLHLGRNIGANIRMAAREACSTTWNFGTTSKFALEPNKLTEYWTELTDRKTFPDAM
jgi:hypothetical protein